MFTDLPLAEVSRLEQLKGAEINEAKKILATETTRLCHGDAAAREAAGTAAKAFTGTAAQGLPTMTLGPAGQTSVVDAVVQLGMAASKSEARRLIEQGGVKLNDRAVISATATISASDLDVRGMARLAVGKKRHGLIRRG
jgi:tyrosyl-tRNA synthetase